MDDVLKRFYKERIARFGLPTFEQLEKKDIEELKNTNAFAWYNLSAAVDDLGKELRKLFQVNYLKRRRL